MAIKLYNGGLMASEERTAWQFGILAIVTYVVYLTIILGEARTTSLLEVDVAWTMIWTILGFVLAAILSSVAKIVAYRRGFQSW